MFLPAFQVQVLTSIEDSGSNPERAQIPLAVNDLTKETRKRRESRYGIEKLEPGQNIHNCLVGRSFAAECLCVKHETLLMLRA
jgi:hypothetical protein